MSDLARVSVALDRVASAAPADRWVGERADFDDFRQHVLAHAARRQANAPRPALRVWSIGSVADAWMAALVARRGLPDTDAWDLAVLASDERLDALLAGHVGRYDAADLAALTADELVSGFGSADSHGRRRVLPELRAYVACAGVDLRRPWLVPGNQDAIFCRRALTQRPQEERLGLARRLAAHLRPGGTLYLGRGHGLDSDDIATPDRRVR